MATKPTATKPAPASDEQAEVDALRRKQHRDRLIKAMDRGYTLPGVRLGDPKSGGADGLVVTFSADEGAEIVEAIRAVVEARK